MDAAGELTDTPPSMQFTLTGAGVQRTWQIRVDQISCGALNTPPHGCVQYFTGVSGTLTSFNFGNTDDYHHLAEQYYSICIRREQGHCKIGYYPSNNGNSFYLSRKP